MADTQRQRATCLACGGPILPVAYGMPTGEMMAAVERGEFLLGGCTIDDINARCECDATAFDSDGQRIQSFTVDDARAYIDEVRWQFAKTMPQWPHEYTVRDWRPELTERFEAFAALIRTDGVVKPWPADSPNPRYHHSYLAIDGWDYWTMGEPIPETAVINRARLSDDWS